MNNSRFIRPPPVQVILRSTNQWRAKACFEVKTRIAAVHECLSGGCHTWSNYELWLSSQEIIWQGSSLNSQAETALPSWHRETLGGRRWRRVRPQSWTLDRAHAFSLQQQLTGETFPLRQPWVKKHPVYQERIKIDWHSRYIYIYIYMSLKLIGQETS